VAELMIQAGALVVSSNCAIFVLATRIYSSSYVHSGARFTDLWMRVCDDLHCETGGSSMR